MIVLYLVVGVGAVIAVVAFAGAGKVYDQIGKGMLSLRDGNDRPARENLSGAAAAAEREDEIRQLLEARNAVRRRAGKRELDVDAELAALLRPAADPSLEAEVRAFVIARNERRERRGQPPLEVEAEVARQLAELS